MSEQERQGRAKAKAERDEQRMQGRRSMWDRTKAFTPAGRRRTAAIESLTARLAGGYDSVQTHRKGYNAGNVGWWGGIEINAA